MPDMKLSSIFIIAKPKNIILFTKEDRIVYA